jgi:hypothetical protein
MTHPWFSKLLIPMNKLIIKIGIRTEKDHQQWKKNYSKAMLEFPGGINDWFAYGVLVGCLIIPIIVLLILFDLEAGYFEEEWKLYALFIGIAVFCYYWIYFKNKAWLKERIDKVSKKYYLK